MPCVGWGPGRRSRTALGPFLQAATPAMLQQLQADAAALLKKADEAGTKVKGGDSEAAIVVLHEVYSPLLDSFRAHCVCYVYLFCYLSYFIYFFC